MTHYYYRCYKRECLQVGFPGPKGSRDFSKYSYVSTWDDHSKPLLGLRSAAPSLAPPPLKLQPRDNNTVIWGEGCKVVNMLYIPYASESGVHDRPVNGISLKSILFVRGSNYPSCLILCHSVARADCSIKILK